MSTDACTDSGSRAEVSVAERDRWNPKNIHRDIKQKGALIHATDR